MRRAKAFGVRRCKSKKAETPVYLSLDSYEIADGYCLLDLAHFSSVLQSFSRCRRCDQGLQLKVSQKDHRGFAVSLLLECSNKFNRRAGRTSARSSNFHQHVYRYCGRNISTDVYISTDDFVGLRTCRALCFLQFTFYSSRQMPNSGPFPVNPCIVLTAREVQHPCRAQVVKLGYR